MGYRVLADAAMLAHFAFLVYLALGGFLGWWRPWLLLAHAPVLLWGLLSVTVGLECPLTVVEDWARHRAGERGLDSGGFIETYLTGVIYPEQYLGLVRALVVVVVVVSWVGAVVRIRRRRTGVPA
ncbi:DUF2784 domain-containing protein [Pseudonocardia sp. H11422]|uniref:DUF2784 domain-containing protein n=1 Tax=Pseudonocardia sp. H11422 TaxID=2835866 RepID=UPI001BDC5D7C|nr:DUF2784 domain-containing protein [Pseudonocardia sp. H11422]